MKTLSLLSLFVMASPLFAADKLSGYSISGENLCGEFPKVNLSTANESCVGIAASEKDGLKRPRRIIQLPDGDFMITDMVGWVANRGIVWRYKTQTKTLVKVLEKVDHAHGLALGPDGLVYVGERSQIFRFNPDAPVETKEIIIKDLPKEGSHPLTHFIFDDQGALIVNVGAPSDQCLDDKKKPVYPCLYEDEAAIRKYERLEDGSYSSSFTVLAQGLRNSMGLAIDPQSGDLYQAENNMDFDKDDGPKEEINLITEGRHYGWPYCYGRENLNPKYKRTFFNRRVPKIDCSIYESPSYELPAHSAPLDMLFYEGDMFPELKGQLILSLHGYRDTGHRIVNIDLKAEKKKHKELVNNWTTDSGLTPKGSPVGMTVAKDGSIWFVEDKNHSIMVLTKGDASQVDVIVDNDDFSISQASKNLYSKLYKKTLKSSCTICHSQFGQDEESSIKQLINDGMIIPGDVETSPLILRTTNPEYGRLMPVGADQLSDNDIQDLKEFILSLK